MSLLWELLWWSGGVLIILVIFLAVQQSLRYKQRSLNTAPLPHSASPAERLGADREIVRTLLTLEFPFLFRLAIEAAAVRASFLPAAARLAPTTPAGVARAVDAFDLLVREALENVPDGAAGTARGDAAVAQMQRVALIHGVSGEVVRCLWLDGCAQIAGFISEFGWRRLEPREADALCSVFRWIGTALALPPAVLALASSLPAVRAAAATAIGDMLRAAKEASQVAVASAATAAEAAEAIAAAGMSVVLAVAHSQGGDVADLVQVSRHESRFRQSARRRLALGVLLALDPRLLNPRCGLDELGGGLADAPLLAALHARWFALHRCARIDPPVPSRGSASSAAPAAGGGGGGGGLAARVLAAPFSARHNAGAIVAVRAALCTAALLLRFSSFPRRVPARRTSPSSLAAAAAANASAAELVGSAGRPAAAAAGQETMHFSLWVGYAEDGYIGSAYSTFTLGVPPPSAARDRGSSKLFARRSVSPAPPGGGAVGGRVTPTGAAAPPTSPFGRGGGDDYSGSESESSDRVPGGAGRGGLAAALRATTPPPPGGARRVTPPPSPTPMGSPTSLPLGSPVASPLGDAPRGSAGVPSVRAVGSGGGSGERGFEVVGDGGSSLGSTSAPASLAGLSSAGVTVRVGQPAEPLSRRERLFARVRRLRHGEHE